MDSGAVYGMHRFGIEDESWFEAARTGLERRGFTLRIQPRSIIIEKEQRLPRIVASAREFLDFAERQGLEIDPAAFDAADRYGDDRSDLSGRYTESPFETPGEAPGSGDYAPLGTEFIPRLTGFSLPEVRAIEQRLAELHAEHERMLADRRAAQAVAAEKQQLEEHCAYLEAELARLSAVATEAVKQRDIWQMSAMSAEERLRVLQGEQEGPGGGGGKDRKFDQLRRFLARELHPDLAGGDGPERTVREALFKRVWAKIEQLQ